MSPNEVRRPRYSRRPQVEGRWRSATTRASGIEALAGESVFMWK